MRGRLSVSSPAQLPLATLRRYGNGPEVLMTDTAKLRAALLARPRRSAAVRAEDAFRLFCLPSARRPPNYAELAQRARFHLRNAVPERFGEVQTYRFEPAGC